MCVCVCVCVCVCACVWVAYILSLFSDDCSHDFSIVIIYHLVLYHLGKMCVTLWLASPDYVCITQEQQHTLSSKTDTHYHMQGDKMLC